MVVVVFDNWPGMAVDGHWAERGAVEQAEKWRSMSRWPDEETDRQLTTDGSPPLQRRVDGY